MIWSITYGNEPYENAKQLNAWSAVNKGKVDKVIVYSPNDIDSDFYAENEKILKEKRGNGYWLWKPYLILKTLNEIPENDYLIYSDAGIIFLKSIKVLIEKMEESNLSVMCFSIDLKEKHYSKRDAFILLNCDSPEFTDTEQRLSGFSIFKNTKQSREIVSQWLECCKDDRINTDKPNVMPYPNYEKFVENRHDQTCWSLVTKTNHIPSFRDPCVSKRQHKTYSKEIAERSNYPQLIEAHRSGKLRTWKDYKKHKRKKVIKKIKKKLGIFLQHTLQKD